ncbi:MAG TPA: zf-HC2 domain-containing protein [Actinomycetota bacterium]|nr:zf-HC2 domain-containing protein [Actinomycetota bacterium]
MNHERCSELLRGYVRGDLPAETADEVRAHLAGCDDCRSEHRAVVAVASVEVAGVAPLDDVERARLHRAIAQEVFATRANADVDPAPAGPPRWTRWVVPAFASAAVLAGILVMTTGGGDDEGVAQFGRVAEEDEGAQELLGEGADAGGGGGKDKGDRRTSAAALDTASGDESSAAAQAAPLRPELDPNAGELTASRLSGIGRGPLFRSLARAYSPADGPRVYDRFLGILQGSPGAAPEIGECAATLPQDGSLIPAYGALGDYDGREVLVLGFVTADPGSDRLDRYLMWVWERGNCDQPIDTLFERIDAG